MAVDKEENQQQCFISFSLLQASFTVAQTYVCGLNFSFKY